MSSDRRGRRERQSTAFGWGNPTFVNTGCDIEFFGTGTGTGASACSGNTSLVRQITAGFWDSNIPSPRDGASPVSGARRSGMKTSSSPAFATIRSE
jgi:hypothetical protein